uniref:PP_kinase_N domain-containing protein n=1 Tax=Heterorhabditis bacteriophora TaxID=37862 RepID=A0A1I7WTP4_HETBA
MNFKYKIKKVREEEKQLRLVRNSELFGVFSTNKIDKLYRLITEALIITGNKLHRGHISALSGLRIVTRFWMIYFVF